MNAHSAPGGWEPQEPKWMAELRRLNEDIRGNVDLMNQIVDHYLKRQRRMLVATLLASGTGYLIGHALVRVIEHFASVP